MPSQMELLQEANRRGILPPDKKPLYDEAVKRGLIKGAQEAGAPGALSEPAKEPAKLAQSGAPQRPLMERIGNNLAGIAEGIMDPVSGAAQMLYNATPAPIRNAVNVANNAVAPVVNRFTEPIGLHMQTLEGPEAMNEMVKQREEDIKKAGITTPSRIVGNILSPVNKIIPGSRVTGKASLGAKIGGGMLSGGTGALLQPVTDGKTTVENFWKEKAQQGALGAGTGGVLSIGGSVISGLKPKKAAEALLKEKIDLTPGQLAGGIARSVEEKLKSLPIVGDFISNAENRALSSFNRVTINKALAPLGQTIAKDAPVGNESIAAGQKILGDAYDAVLPKVSFSADKSFVDGLQKTLKKSAASSALPHSNKVTLEKFLTERVHDRLQESGGKLNGEIFKQIESELGEFARDQMSSSVPGDRAMGKLAGQVRDLMRSGLERQNPTVAKDLQNINKAYSMFSTIEAAAARRAGSEGVFSPHDLMSAVKSSDRTVRHRAFAAGRAQMQRWAQNGQSVLPNRVPNSGTADRSAVAGLVAATLGGQIPVIGPALAGTIGTGALAYSKPGVTGLRALMSGAPGVRSRLGEFAQRSIPGVSGGLVRETE